jgi:hypothetical protein
MRGIRRRLLLSVSLTLFPSVSFAADPFAEYRIPDHRWLSWSAGLNAGGNHYVVDDVGGEQRLQRVFSGNGSSSFVGGYDSDTHSRAYGLSLRFQGSRENSERNDFLSYEIDEAQARSQRASERVSLFYALSHFPWQVPLGFSLATSDAIRLDQSWTADDEVRTIIDPFFPGAQVRTSSNSTAGTYVADATLTGSVRWGRVRDATPVYQVHVLEDRLRETGAIQGELSHGARERLAALYTVEFDLSFAHQRPTKYFWRELERLLSEDGVLGAGGLDAYTVQRLLEPLAILGDRSFPRFRGWAVGPQVMLAKRWSHSSGLSESRRVVLVADTLFDSSSVIQPRTETDRHDESIFTGAFVEYHRPIGMKWQADAFSRALLSEAGEDLVLSTDLSATWSIADRWQWAGDLFHDATAPGSGVDRKVERWALIVGTSLSYFLEDNWAFQFSYQHGQGHSPTGFSRTDGYSLGVSYQFAGWLDAPAVFAPMRLTPPAH